MNKKGECSLIYTIRLPVENPIPIHGFSTLFSLYFIVSRKWMKGSSIGQIQLASYKQNGTSLHSETEMPFYGYFLFSIISLVKKLKKLNFLQKSQFTSGFELKVWCTAGILIKITFCHAAKRFRFLKKIYSWICKANKRDSRTKYSSVL